MRMQQLTFMGCFVRIYRKRTLFYLIWGCALPRIKLTLAVIDGLPAPDPSGKQILYWDAELKGFGVVCSGKTGAKTYIVQRDIYGKTRRIKVGAVNVLSLDKARGEAVKLLAEFVSGVDPQARRRADADAARRDREGAVTLQMALDDFVAAKVGLKSKTIADTKAVFSRHLKDWAGRPLREITRADVVAKHRAIKMAISVDETPDSRTGAIPGGCSANIAVRVIRGLYNHARLSVPALPENPVSRISWYPEPRRTGVVRHSDMAKFYEMVRALPNKVVADYITLVLFTGLRRREAAALRWEEVDLTEKVIRLPRARTKAARQLDLPMSDMVFNLLSARRKIGLAPGGWVFPANSREGHISEPRFALDDVAKATGIDVTVHDLRRTFITVAESCDISAFALKGLVNHSMGGDVTAGYVVTSAERLRAPMQKVADRLKELCGIPEDQ